MSIRPVYDAWHTPGREPGYHAQAKAQLRREWPVLASALDHLQPNDVAQIITVSHHDIEAHAASFNEGYAAAMTQHLADDPTAAEAWLKAHDADVWDEGAEHAVGYSIAPLYDNPYRDEVAP